MTLNISQRIVIYLAALLVVVAFLCPPWACESLSFSKFLSTETQYSLIWSRPEVQEGLGSCAIDVALLLTEILGLAIVALALTVGLRTRRK